MSQLMNDDDFHSLVHCVTVDSSRRRIVRDNRPTNYHCSGTWRCSRCLSHNAAAGDAGRERERERIHKFLKRHKNVHSEQGTSGIVYENGVCSVTLSDSTCKFSINGVTVDCEIWMTENNFIQVIAIDKRIGVRERENVSVVVAVDKREVKKKKTKNDRYIKRNTLIVTLTLHTVRMHWYCCVVRAVSHQSHCTGRWLVCENASSLEMLSLTHSANQCREWEEAFSFSHETLCLPGESENNSCTRKTTNTVTVKWEEGSIVYSFCDCVCMYACGGISVRAVSSITNHHTRKESDFDASFNGNSNWYTKGDHCYSFSSSFSRTHTQ